MGLGQSDPEWKEFVTPRLFGTYAYGCAPVLLSLPSLPFSRPFSLHPSAPPLSAPLLSAHSFPLPPGASPTPPTDPPLSHTEMTWRAWGRRVNWDPKQDPAMYVRVSKELLGESLPLAACRAPHAVCNRLP